MKQHEVVVFELGGLKKSLVVEQPHCGVAASRVHAQKLFRNLILRYQPIATKSRKFNNNNRQFMYNEFSKRLNDNIIEPPYSSRPAQVPVTKDEHHKRRKVLNYSQTINKFTLLELTLYLIYMNK